jgi:hypothetical protein
LGGHSDGDGDGLINEEIDCTGILKVGVGRVLIGCTLNQEKNRFVVFDVEMFGSGWKSLVVDTVRNDDGSEEGILGFRGQLTLGVFGGARKFLMIYDQFSYEIYHEARFDSQDSRVIGEDHQGLRV